MAAHQILEQQILSLMRSMEAEGMTSEVFEQVRETKELNGPFYFAELISEFYTGFEATMAKLTDALDNQDVDFVLVHDDSIKIEGTSGSIGFQRLAPACSDLRKYSDSGSKEGCLLAFNALKLAYLDLKEKLDDVLLLEWRIVAGPVV